MHGCLEVLRELWADRRRSGLCVVALAWGTLGLTVLAGFGAGFDSAMRDVLHRSGDSLLRIRGGATTRPAEGLAAGRLVVVGLEDVEALREVPGVRRLSVEHARSLRITAGAASHNTNVRGVDAEFGALRGFSMQAGGRFLSSLDLAERRHVAVLGANVARALFGRASPLGRAIAIDSRPYVVIGVVEPRAASFTYDGEDSWKAFVPATTLRAEQRLRAPS